LSHHHLMDYIVYLLSKGGVGFLEWRGKVDLLQQCLRAPDDFVVARESPCEVGEELISHAFERLVIALSHLSSKILELAQPSLTLWPSFPVVASFGSLLP
jgi:hypothetical protein